MVGLIFEVAHFQPVFLPSFPSINGHFSKARALLFGSIGLLLCQAATLSLLSTRFRMVFRHGSGRLTACLR